MELQVVVASAAVEQIAIEQEYLGGDHSKQCWVGLDYRAEGLKRVVAFHTYYWAD